MCENGSFILACVLRFMFRTLEWPQVQTCGITDLIGHSALYIKDCPHHFGSHSEVAFCSLACRKCNAYPQWNTACLTSITYTMFILDKVLTRTYCMEVMLVHNFSIVECLYPKSSALAAWFTYCKEMETYSFALGHAAINTAQSLNITHRSLWNMAVSPIPTPTPRNSCRWQFSSCCVCETVGNRAELKREFLELFQPCIKHIPTG